MSKKSRGKYSLIGFLVILVLVASYWGFNYLKGNDLFNKQNTFHVVYESINGLNVSSPVTINGYKVGQVTEIHMLHQQNANLLISFDLSNEYPIPQNSIARIYSTDLMGTKGIKIELADSELLHIENDTLIGKMEQSLRDQVSIQMLPLKNQAEELMSEIESAIAVIQNIFNEKTQRNLQNSFESIKQTVSYLESSSQNLDSLMSDQKTRIARILEYSERITKNLDKNSDAITNTIKNLSQFSDSLAVINLVQTIDNANKIVGEFAQISEKINKGEGSLGMLINNDSLYLELERASVNLDRLIYDIRMNPEHYVNVKLINFGKEVRVVDESMLNEREKRQLKKKRERLKEQDDNPR
ncbi:MAG: MlaD family protein [Bacteroidota bacterium]|nr:MlaD family protein [Bacteroidota bacterium]